jgi:hypothetical protein
MTDHPREGKLSDAYSRLHKELTSVLYNVDPGGMGRTVGAPEDEYSGIATTLCNSLRGTASSDDVRGVLERIFGADLVNDELVAQVYSVWGSFLRQTGSEPPPKLPSG